VEVRDAGGWVGESAPLLERGHDVDEDCGFDACGRAGRGQEAVADAGAAVVGDPVDWAGGGVGEDAFEGFQDGEADLAFVGAFGEGAYAVAWELGDEEGGVWFPGFDYLWVDLVVSRYLIWNVFLCLEVR
jgi:hypothetical protein